MGIALAILCLTSFSYAQGHCFDTMALLNKEMVRQGQVRIAGRIPINTLDFQYMNLDGDKFATYVARYLEEIRGFGLHHEQAKGFHDFLVSHYKNGEPVATEALSKWLTQHEVFSEDSAEKFAQVVGQRWKNLVKKNRPLAPAQLEINDLKADANSALRTTIEKNNIPHYEITNAAGEKIPVVLANRETYPHLKPVLEENLQYGQAVKLFPGSGDTDHGVIRVKGQNIDWYFPGGLGFSETHNSGLGWREFQALLNHSKGTNPIAEVAYALSPEETRAVELYNRMRRGNLFQVRNKWVADNPAYNRHTAVLDRGFENCYMYGTGICSIEHARNMTDFLGRMGVDDVEKLLETPEARKFLEMAEKQIMDLPLNDPKYINDARAQETILHDWILGQNPEYVKIMKDVMPEHVKTDEDRVRFFNYLLGVDATRKHAAVMDNLGQLDFSRALTNVDNDWVYDRSLWPRPDANRPRVSAIVVFDANPQAVEKFGNHDYDGAWMYMPVTEGPKAKY